MFSNTSIRLRLIATMSLLGLLIIVTGISGLYGMSTVNASLNDLSSNTMPSAIAIANSQLAMSRARLVLDRVTLHPEAPGAEKTLARAEAFMAESDQAWALYLSLPQDEGEKPLASEMDLQRKRFMEQAMQPLVKSLKAKDVAEADTITMKLMQPLFTGLSDSATALTGFQDRANRLHDEESQATYRRLWWLTAGAIALGVAMILFASVSLTRSILDPIKQISVHFTHIAEGNLSQPITSNGHDEMAVLMRGLATMQARLATTVGGVRDGTAAITTATGEIAAGNLDLSRRTEQQAASLEKTAASLEQLASTVKQNAEHARQSNQLACVASDVAIKGGNIVSGVVNTMDAIRASSTRIGDIIGVIDGIAFQTNILALNAAVEAARAGEQGRGFAVVASEVRHLAQRSADAAKDIRTLITNSVAQVDSGGKLVSEAGATMDEIVASTRRVADIMGEISVAGHEQEVGIDQINQAVAELDAATQQNAALVEQAAAASASLREQADKLTEMVGSFRLAPQTGAGLPSPRLALAGTATN
ncbi:HAMP domain-containing protein [Duganella sp. BJB488]|uniref:methyl-accepting chemotaxis protein n=1 Tax=unclassified Duganella TaxID=2636909 RepID=UPI000E34ECF8|nr:MULTISPECIES: methyl-accepting chemotaxis protein [unclassified Duganella]RFP13144.1 HAMP domain-containing protein [Duganella sp. BJB489]RFP17093.1 HAMP domain-containing protein [Duganella sp. BJB488]RFP31688.1 HAMP domain-containing protein [Duganella sp. BJB480]